MIRSKLQVTVFGNTHDQIIREVNRIVYEYLELSDGNINDHADIEIEVKDAGTQADHLFVATAYVRIK